MAGWETIYKVKDIFTRLLRQTLTNKYPIRFTRLRRINTEQCHQLLVLLAGFSLN